MKARRTPLDYLIAIGSIALVVLFVFAVDQARAGEQYQNRSNPNNISVNSNNSNTVDKSVTNTSYSEADAFSFSSADNNLEIGVDLKGGDISFNTPDTQTIKNTAPAIAPNIYPSGNCYMAWSAGGSIPGLNLSGGKAYLDKGCDAREWARLMFQMGARAAALELMCMQPVAAEVEGCRGTQDYNKEMALVRLDNAELVKDYEKQRAQIRALEQSNEEWKEKERERRMLLALEK